MKPKRPQEVVQNDLFKTRLDEFLNPKHELYRLASKIDWARLDEEFGPFFEAEQGAPALSTRLIAGLHYLKHAEGLSDEAVVKRWVENGYWQYFCGETFFQHEVPCHPTSLTKWRQRIGEAGCEWLLLLTIEAGVATRTVKKRDFQSVTVDTTVQEKAVGFPTDGKLYEKCRRELVKLAGQHGLPLRQNYNKKAPLLLVQSHRYHHAKQMKRKQKALKQLKTLVGRVYRDILRQLPQQELAAQRGLQDALAKTQRILNQKHTDKNKLYSFHAPEVECISKGKAHKKYEFGVKVGITVTNKSNFVLGARSFPGNPYDGDTLYSCLEQAEILSGTRAKEAFVDLGYRGREIPGVTLYKSRQKRGVHTRRLKTALKRRNAIEPVIGHMKNDGLLSRNYLKGQLGDAMNAVLCAAGHNMRLILRRLRIFWPEIGEAICRFLQNKTVQESVYVS
ncbi:IS5 family transposase [Methylosarcina fibrata]|uniref:IS5 family transposase n=1 Tax=Methylosarcina fibrata TaxID=105972 RepID=UPI0003777B79|nr:IS5 family transposase [Methylosarcina fibrata]HNC32081.1 IS5 family transposase [Cyclobacteriaceae bacterium]